MSQTTQVGSASREQLARSQPTHQTKRRRAKAVAARSPLAWGSAFLGWCAAIGLAALLLAGVSAAAAAILLSQGSGGLLEKNASALFLMGAISVVFCLSFAFYIGGYVAGRMARFEGGRHGLAVWLWAVAIAIVLCVTGGFLVVNFNLYELVSRPQLPLATSELMAGAAVTSVVTALTTLGGAIHGGRSGARLHGVIDLSRGLDG